MGLKDASDFWRYVFRVSEAHPEAVAEKFEEIGGIQSSNAFRAWCNNRCLWKVYNPEKVKYVWCNANYTAGFNHLRSRYKNPKRHNVWWEFERIL